MNRTVRIGLFTTLGIGLIIGFSFYVNDKPDWRGRCVEVKIYTDDATGLRRKSAVKTLGLDIGFIKKVELDGEQVLITVCVTAPVKILDETKPYIRSQGFLGDKFLELKPVEMLGAVKSNQRKAPAIPAEAAPSSEPDTEKEKPQQESLLEDLPSEVQEMMKHQRKQEHKAAILRVIDGALDILVPSARAEEGDVPVLNEAEPKRLNASRETEMQDLLKKVGKLVDKLTLVMDDIRTVTQQKEFKETVVNLNQAMKNLETLLRPNGKVVANVNASLESLKNAMSEAEQVMHKVNSGEGTIGKFVNDPSIFDELKAAINSINLLLGRAGTLKTFVDMSAINVGAYDGVKGRLNIIIQPNPTRYYLLGFANDPRGRTRRKTTETVTNGGAVTKVEESTTEEKGLKITAMFGKYFGPLDLRAGLLEDNGAVGVGLWLDPKHRYGLHAEFFSPEKGDPVTARVYARAQLFMTAYITGGVDQIKKFNGKTPYFVGFGIFFDDDDLKYLLAFK